MIKPKKILVAIPILIMTIFIISGIAYGASDKTGTINADSVNVRATPETSSKVNFMLSKGTNVSIIEKSNDWYKISYNDADGWVFGQFVDVKDSQIGTGTVNATNVNVRSKPDKDAEVITRLDKGIKVKIFEYSGEWAKILVEEDRYGWISKDYLTVAKETVSRGLTSDVREPVKTEDVESDEDDSKVESSQDTDLRQQIVEYAKKYLGVKYKYGSSSPKGFDCSGFVLYVYKHFGITLERTSADQGNHGTKIDKEDLKPGDLVFFDTNGGHNAIEHVGMYIGDGKFIHASSGSSRCVTISSLNEGFYDNAYMRSRRYIDD
jgi:Cell wall-associated hydrolases (invasion-associated proteins)